MNNPTNLQRYRRKRAKGIWMRTRDPKLIPAYMDHLDYTQARLARFVNAALAANTPPSGKAKTCGRQYIHLLATGKRRTCSTEVAEAIEEALRVLPGTIFAEEKSATSERRRSRRGTAA